MGHHTDYFSSSNRILLLLFLSLSNHLLTNSFREKRYGCNSPPQCVQPRWSLKFLLCIFFFLIDIFWYFNTPMIAFDKGSSRNNLQGVVFKWTCWPFLEGSFELFDILYNNLQLHDNFKSAHLTIAMQYMTATLDISIPTSFAVQWLPIATNPPLPWQQ